MNRELSILFVVVLMLSVFVPMATMTMATTTPSYKVTSTTPDFNAQLTGLNKLADKTTQDVFKDVLTKFDEARRVSLSLPPNEKVVGVLSNYLETGEIPEKVRVYRGFNGEPESIGIIITDSSARLAEISRYATVKSIYPLGFANIIVATVSSQMDLMHLAAMPTVVEIMGDIQLEYPEIPEFAYDLGSQVGLTQFNATYIQGSWNASNEFGVNGSGVKIAVIDTGVDFGNPEVRQARDADGYPLSINLDGIGLGFATLEVNKSDVINNTILPVAGKTVYYFTPRYRRKARKCGQT